jgi:tetratricopeptide (TPR) repeat protein
VSGVPATTAPPGASLRQLVLEKVPLFALVAGWSVLAFFAQREGGAIGSFDKYPLQVRLDNALLAYVAYLAKALWPVNLAVYYPHPGAAVSGKQALEAGLLLLLLSAFLLGLGRRLPYLAVGWLWFLGTLVPVIGLVQIGTHGMADRYCYVPLIGLFLMFTWSISDLVQCAAAVAAVPRLVPRFVLVASSAALLAGCAIGTWVQLGFWDGDVALWEHAIAVTDRNVTAHHNLGFAFTTLGRADEAVREYRIAIEADPSFAASHDNLASQLWFLGRREEAVSEYEQALRLNPSAGPTHHNLANSLYALGRLDEAEREYRLTVELEPNRAEDYCRLGALLTLKGQFPAALAQYRRGHEVGSQQDGWPWPSAQWVKEAEDLVELDAKLPAILGGQAQPAGASERIALAELCWRYKHLYALSARLYAEAFAADPDRADERRIRQRYAAACAAAQSAAGQGQDAATLPETERARLRGQALEWLRSDLAAWAKQAETARPQDRADVLKVLRLWQQSQDLASVRDAPGLAKLPPAERKGWDQLWQEVAAILARN